MFVPGLCMVRNMPEQAGITRKQVQESKSKARWPSEGTVNYVLLEASFRSSIID